MVPTEIDFREAAEILGLSDPAFVEKDYFGFLVLDMISGLETEGLKPVFGGGTSITRAFGLTKRMSEDIDFKLLSPGGSSTRGQRRAFHQSVKQTLEDIDFYPEGQMFDYKVSNQHKKITYKIPYRTVFDPTTALRPEIQLDLFTPEIPYDFEVCSFGPLIEEALPEGFGKTSVSVTKIDQTFVDKLVSFPKRVSHFMQGRTSSLEKEQIRHVYDVHMMRDFVKNDSNLARRFTEVISADAKRQKNQYPEFSKNPVGEIKTALEHIGGNPEFRENYENFVLPMVYGTSTPDWDEVWQTYRSTLEKIFEELSEN